MSARRPLPVDDLSRVEWAAAREILGRDVAIGASVLRVSAGDLDAGDSVYVVPPATPGEQSVEPVLVTLRRWRGHDGTECRIGTVSRPHRHLADQPLIVVVTPRDPSPSPRCGTCGTYYTWMYSPPGHESYSQGCTCVTTPREPSTP